MACEVKKQAMDQANAAADQAAAERNNALTLANQKQQDLETAIATARNATNAYYDCLVGGGLDGR